MMQPSLCLLTFNELVGCRHDVPLLNRAGFGEIYAIDGGSTDGTLEYLRSEGIPVYVQPQKGLNAACVHALDKCTTDALVFFHPKGTVPVDDALKFQYYFEGGYEFVVASRLAPRARNEEDARFLRPRKWFVQVLALTAAIAWRREGNMVWDVLHGFRGVTRRAFELMRIRPHGVSVDLEMVVRAYKHRIRRIEFPTREQPRRAGKTHFRAVPTGLRLCGCLLRELHKKSKLSS